MENEHQGAIPSEANLLDRIRQLEDQVETLKAQLQMERENPRLSSRLPALRKLIMLNRILDVLPVGVWLTNEDGKIIQVNIAAQLIWSGAKMVNVEQYQEFKGWWPDSGNSVLPNEWPMVRAIRFGETCLNDEIEIESFDGRRKIVSNSAIPLFSGTQEVTGAIVIFEDISLRKQAEMALIQANQKLEQRVRERTQALETSNQDLEDFAFVASHDLQEPLRKVTSFGKLLMEKAGARLDPQEQDYILRMSNAADRMSEMLHGLLNYSRLNTRTRPYEIVNLERTVMNVLVDLDITIKKAGGKVEVNELPHIEADPVQMRQLFQNLISNALKFHKPGIAPFVQVYQKHESTEGESGERCADGFVTLVVKDNGIGFNPDLKDTMFQPFSRLVGRSEFEGTGIGLSICRKIVERHDGTIDAHGVPGEGASFIIRLPSKQAEKHD